MLMPISDLELILAKDPVISTWPATSLIADPGRVERDYLVHARTHIPLGNTAEYVDTIFRWVSGVNQGTFIGGVLGDYGEGKTSLLVHVWAESRERKVFTVPPFEWTSFGEVADAVAAWADYVLAHDAPELAGRARRLHERFREQALDQVAQEQARTTGSDYEVVLQTLRAAIEAGGIRLERMSAAQLLDFVAEITDVVREAGYEGTLVLLDEPEVAAKQLGNSEVQFFLFHLANELLRRNGNYGVFLSMPANFYATAQSRFAALPARLAARGCFPSLGDLYGPQFARDLWHRYVQEFAPGSESDLIVTDLALSAIGQIGSSEQRHLAYGPRTVVSAFRRMVEFSKDNGTPYHPSQLVQDLLDEEILARPEYRTHVNQVLRAPDVGEANRAALQFVAAFPSGLHVDTIRAQGYEENLRSLSRADGLVYRTAYTMGLRALRPADGAGADGNPLRDHIQEIDSEYAPDRAAFGHALQAFASHVIPRLFVKQQGQQLTGWQYLTSFRKAADGVLLATVQGAFDQMSRRFPLRPAIIILAGSGSCPDDVEVPELDESLGLQDYDLIYHFTLRWNAEQPQFPQRARVITRPNGVPILAVNVDLTSGLCEQAVLSEWVGAERLTPLWVLNLLARMETAELGMHLDAEWTALRDQLVTRGLIPLALDRAFADSLAQSVKEQLGEQLSGSHLTHLDQASAAALAARYPEYQTLIRQPHWRAKVDDYVKVLRNRDIPLGCRRGREVWRVDGEAAARVFGTSRMNLSSAFQGFESLIEITSTERRAPLQIRFRVHPLEERIRSLVCTDEKAGGLGRRIKRDGKEGWAAHQSDLLPELLGQGYQKLELAKIIDMGLARGSYETGNVRGEPVICCMPLDVADLKAQLATKLEDLKAELAQYRQLDGFQSSFDPDRMVDDIANLKDDADYEPLLRRMNAEFTAIHSRLPTYFDSLKEKLTKARREVDAINNRLSDSRDFAQLSAPAHRSPWGAPLGRHITPNLQKNAEDLRQQSKGLLAAIDSAELKYGHSHQRPPGGNLALLREGLAETATLVEQAQALKSQADVLVQHVSQYGHWVALLRGPSDELYDRLLRMKADPAHEACADRFLETFTGISDTIALHLEARNVNGLANHGQFRENIEELERDLVQYVGALGSTFNQCKERLNQILGSFGIDPRVTAVFNQGDMRGSYEQLYRDGVALLRQHAWRRALGETEDQVRDVAYCRDILRALSPDEAAGLLAPLHASKEAISPLEAKVDETWLRQAVESESSAHLHEALEALRAADEAIRASRRRVGDVSKPAQPEDERARSLYALLPETGAADLKQLVLSMMQNGTEPSVALDASLDALAELFRCNSVHISVERRRR